MRRRRSMMSGQVFNLAIALPSSALAALSFTVSGDTTYVISFDLR